MAFKMRCPKCLGLDYSIERDNRTFGAVAQAFELVFHCRCGKQMFGETLLKEYELQKKDFEARGGVDSDDGKPRRREEEDLRARLEQRKRAAEARRPAEEPDLDEDSEGNDASDEDKPADDRKWRQRMAALTADDGDDDDEDDSPAPAPSRTSRAKGSRAPSRAPAAAEKEPETGGGRSRGARAGSSKAAAPKESAKVLEDEEEDEEELPSADSEPAPSNASEAEEEEDDDDGDKTICGWPGCNNPRRSNSKYCSRACSNKNARSRHKTRVKKPGKKGDHLAA